MFLFYSLFCLSKVHPFTRTLYNVPIFFTDIFLTRQCLSKSISVSNIPAIFTYMKCTPIHIVASNRNQVLTRETVRQIAWRIAMKSWRSNIAQSFVVYLVAIRRCTPESTNKVIGVFIDERAKQQTTSPTNGIIHPTIWCILYCDLASELAIKLIS